MSEKEKASFFERIKGHLFHIFDTMFGHGQWKSWLLLPLCLLICLGMYYGAKGISALRLHAAEMSAQNMKVEVREGNGTYYFNTLSGREQHVYDAMDKALSVCSEQTVLLSFAPTASEFCNAAAAVFCDRPEYVGVIFDAVEMQTSRYSARISFSYTDDASERREALHALSSELLLEMPKELQTAYDRAVWIHDALVERAAYLDENGKESSGRTDAYDALSAVPCDGFAYASAYAYLCREAEISAEIVLGTANAGAHAWNALILNEGVGYVDVMWNDTPTKESALPFHGYFMLSKAEISLDHTFTDDALFGESESANYYEYYGFTVSDNEDASERLVSHLIHAAQSKASAVELLLGASLADDAVFKECLRGALAIVAEQNPDLGIRTVNRIYHASDSMSARTVQLFYEE